MYLEKTQRQEYWRGVLKHLIQKVLILAEHCLALHETSGKLREEGKGKFQG